MRFHEYEKVRVPKYGITGEIIDISRSASGKTIYLVEDDEEWSEERIDAAWNDPDLDANIYPDRWPRYDCTEDDLEKIE